MATWQENLESYKNPANSQAALAEIKRAGDVYTQKMNAGDTAGAQAAHTWANQIRDAMGISNQFDRTTGAALNTASNAQSLRDWGTANGVDVGYNNGQITLSKNGNSVVGTNIGGLTLDTSKGLNYISDPSVFNTAISSLLKAKEPEKVTTPTPAVAATPKPTDINSVINGAFSTLQSKYDSLLSSLKNTGSSSSAPDLQGTIETLRSQLDPQHAITKQKIAKAKEDSLKAVMENLAKRGGGLESSEADKQIAELYANADNANALADAEYESMLASLGQTGYENAMSRYENAQNMYTQAATNLGMSFLTGAIDLAKFLYDASYREAVLGSDEANTYLTQFGSVA